MKSGIGGTIIIVLLAGCRAPKYSRFVTPSGDWSCDAPTGWTAYPERQGRNFASLTFAGSFDPDFIRGVPSVSVRWYAAGKARRLADGSAESFASAQDFIDRTLREVYGPEPFLEEGPKDVEVSGWQARYFVVVSPAPPPPGAKFGLSEDGSGRAVNLRQHAYVVLPMDTGFYVLTYPATRHGYPSYLDRFNRLINTFHVYKEGPGGPALR